MANTTHIYKYPRVLTDTPTHIINPNMGGNGGSASGVTYLTEAPTEDNPDDDLKFVVLDQEPATKYEGYFYIILED